MEHLLQLSMLLSLQQAALCGDEEEASGDKSGRQKDSMETSSQ